MREREKESTERQREGIESSNASVSLFLHFLFFLIWISWFDLICYHHFFLSHFVVENVQVCFVKIWFRLIWIIKWIFFFWFFLWFGGWFFCCCFVLFFCCRKISVLDRVFVCLFVCFVLKIEIYKVIPDVAVAIRSQSPPVDGGSGLVNECGSSPELSFCLHVCLVGNDW